MCNVVGLPCYSILVLNGKCVESNYPNYCNQTVPRTRRPTDGTKSKTGNGTVVLHKYLVGVSNFNPNFH